jgi:signal transduction histidine kinase
LTALVFAGGAMLFYDLTNYRRSWAGDIRTQAELLGQTVTPAMQFGDPETGQEILDLLRIRPKIAAAAVYNARGNVFASYSRSPEEDRFPKLPGEEGVRVQGANLIAYERIEQNDEILGTVYIRADYELYDRVLGYLGIIAFITLLAMLVGTAVSLWLQSVITRPILNIAGIAREVVAKRDYSQRADKLTDDEVGALVDSFNDMLDEIQQRTRELEESNRELARESEERQRASDEVLRLNEQLEQRVHERTAQLQVINQELESFCYSVSHDLRGPLRAIDGFSEALSEELPEELNDDARRYMERIRAATQRMGQLIEDLLNLSRVSRQDFEPQPVDLSVITEEVVEALRMQEPDRQVDVSVWPGMDTEGDPRLLRVVLENLIGNAWKFTSKTESPRIEIGTLRDGEHTVFFVRDNGAGFDMAYADKLFGAFQRLHAAGEFPGTGIGLATVQRIINRHGGRIWVDAAPGEGARFYFTLTTAGQAIQSEYPDEPAAGEST